MLFVKTLTIFFLTCFALDFRDDEEDDVAPVKHGRGRPPKAKTVKRYVAYILPDCYWSNALQSRSGAQ